MEALTYRWEHPMSGRGPYTHWRYVDQPDIIFEMHEAHDDDEHPPDTDDGLYDTVKGMYHPRFGCVSREALGQWFNGYEPDLFHLGFRIKVYEAYAEIGISGVQCVFDLDEVISSYMLDDHHHLW